MLKIHELLSDPKRHCKGALARNERGESVPFDDPFAACWCLVGAAYYCYKDLQSIRDVLSRLEQALSQDYDLAWLATYNDNEQTTPQEVCELARRIDV
jgi:hypothetical protein